MSVAKANDVEMAEAGKNLDVWNLRGHAAGKESKDRVSGSGVWARDPDALVTLTPHENEGAFAVDFTLRNFAPRSYGWDCPLMRQDATLDPAALKSRRAGRRSSRARL